MLAAGQDGGEHGRQFAAGHNRGGGRAGGNQGANETEVSHHQEACLVVGVGNGPMGRGSAGASLGPDVAAEAKDALEDRRVDGGHKGRHRVPVAGHELGEQAEVAGDKGGLVGRFSTEEGGHQVRHVVGANRKQDGVQEGKGGRGHRLPVRLGRALGPLHPVPRAEHRLRRRDQRLGQVRRRRNRRKRLGDRRGRLDVRVETGRLKRAVVVAAAIVATTIGVAAANKAKDGATDRGKQTLDCVLLVHRPRALAGDQAKGLKHALSVLRHNVRCRADRRHVLAEPLPVHALDH